MKFKFLFLFFISCVFGFSQEMPEVDYFGSNPGNLSLFYHAPKNVKTGMPLVVVLHGCSQSAKGVSELTGWNKLADEYGFYVMYPQQHVTNNPSHCFNWFKKNEIEKGNGECESIAQMVRYMLKNFSVDTARIFVTGLSAGAAMSVVMIATQPAMFKAAAIFAGGPYKPGSNIFSSSGSMMWGASKTPEEWKELVWRENPAFKGKYPKVFIFHGEKDPIVNIRNANEIVKQWTCLNKIDTVPDEILAGYLHAPDVKRISFQDSSGDENVVFYKIADLGHAIPVNPGYCKNQGGKTGVFATDKGFYSTYYTACEFGLIPNWKVEGPDRVRGGQTCTFSVPASPDYKYTWTFPEGCIIKAGGDSNMVTVIWGNVPGKVTVEEFAPGGCRYYHGPLKVSLRKS